MAIKTDLWAPKRRIETRYKRAILTAIWRLEQSLNGLDDPVDILRGIHEFTLSESFDRYCKATAGQMVTHLFTDAGRTWRQAAHANSKGRMIYEALMKEMKGPLGVLVNQEIHRNAELIKTLPLDIAKHVNQHILTESLKGKRSSDIAKEIQAMFPEKSKARANLIARTEVGKTSTALTQARSQLLNIPAYIWRTSEDSRVRKAHEEMEGVVVFWGDEPNPEKLFPPKDKKGNPLPVHHGPYNAGCIWNCRCYTEALLDLDQIKKWPVKVHYYGQLRNMSRKDLEKIIRTRVPAVG